MDFDFYELLAVAGGVFVAFFMLFNRGEDLPSFFREPISRTNMSLLGFFTAFVLNFAAAELICEFIYEAVGPKQNFLSSLAAIGLIGGYKALQKYG